MIENFINIETKDGLIDTFEVKPDEGGPFPAIIIYMDAPAIREELRDMARRLASMGYYVLLPNLFYRVGKEGSYPFTFAKIRDDKSHFSAMIKTMDDTTNELVVSDTKYILDYLDNNEELKAVRIVDMIVLENYDDEIIKQIINYCINKIDFIDFFCTGNFYKTSFEKNGFFNNLIEDLRIPTVFNPIDLNRRPEINFFYKQSNLNSSYDESFNEINNWYFVKGDSDQDRANMIQ